MLVNEGTIDGTYTVIEKIFLEQFSHAPEKDFSRLLQLVFGDQKTISLIQAVKKEREESTSAFDTLAWLLPIPGLFHWRTNYIDMIFDLYSGSEFPGDPTTLTHNGNYLGFAQGHNSPFHHKQEVAMKAFDARVIAAFYSALPKDVAYNDCAAVDHHIISLEPSKLLEQIRDIRQSLFHHTEQSTQAAKPDTPVDKVFSVHAKFLQQMALYKSLKHAIKHGDIGMIQQVIARCCILFQGAKKTKYVFLSLYMTWLTQTKAASPELQTAILANGLVNLQGTKDGWFEMDRLNEFFNLHMKIIMATR